MCRDDSPTKPAELHDGRSLSPQEQQEQRDQREQPQSTIAVPLPAILRKASEYAASECTPCSERDCVSCASDVTVMISNVKPERKEVEEDALEEGTAPSLAKEEGLRDGAANDKDGLGQEEGHFRNVDNNMTTFVDPALAKAKNWLVAHADDHAHVIQLVLELRHKSKQTILLGWDDMPDNDKYCVCEWYHCRPTIWSSMFGWWCCSSSCRRRTAPGSPPLSPRPPRPETSRSGLVENASTNSIEAVCCGSSDEASAAPETAAVSHASVPQRGDCTSISNQAVTFGLTTHQQPCSSPNNLSLDH